MLIYVYSNTPIGAGIYAQTYAMKQLMLCKIGENWTIVPKIQGDLGDEMTYTRPTYASSTVNVRVSYTNPFYDLSHTIDNIKHNRAPNFRSPATVAFQSRN